MAEAKMAPRSLHLNMKAGMEGLEMEKINQIIQQVSVGSNYYLHQQKKQRHIDEKIKQMKTISENITNAEIAAAIEKMDKMAEKLESTRRLDKIIVHVDMDAFFAAVEMKNNPQLKDKPMAVGCQSMLSTSNYLARRFGVRAAMPGFIAMKLCPELIIVPPNFAEYQRVSKQVQSVFDVYDPHFSSVSLDEAYLDVTNYVESHKKNDDVDRMQTATRVVHEMRKNIFKATELTASAGIAPNMMLAKICSDKNKPNGQFEIKPCRKEILEFIQDLPVRKVNGIGNVTEQLLNSQGIITCSDLWQKRGLVNRLFSSSSTDWFLRIAMGIGSVHVNNDDYVRKSISVERTFNDTSNATVLHQLCQEMCEELSSDLQAEKMVGKTVTVKLKMSDFTVKTKASTLRHATAESKLIAALAHSLLSSEIKSNEQLKLRLMGVRISSLTSTCNFKQQITLDTLFTKRNLISGSSEACNDDEINESQQQDSKTTQENDNRGRTTTAEEGALDLKSSTATSSQKHLNENNIRTFFLCPVCDVRQTCSLQDFNQHVDLCLNKSAIKQILSADVNKVKESSTTEVKKRKRSVNNVGTIEKFIQRSKKSQQ
uniref:DNA polymerase kappa n=1 Tax=Strigamia maritima TaxID=126957 RepID=T1IUC3_STRMM